VLRSLSASGALTKDDVLALIKEAMNKQHGSHSSHSSSSSSDEFLKKQDVNTLLKLLEQLLEQVKLQRAKAPVSSSSSSSSHSSSSSASSSSSVSKGPSEAQVKEQKKKAAIRRAQLKKARLKQLIDEAMAAYEKKRKAEIDKIPPAFRASIVMDAATIRKKKKAYLKKATAKAKEQVAAEEKAGKFGF